jgi:hypothetical protein
MISDVFSGISACVAHPSSISAGCTKLPPPTFRKYAA